MTYDVWKKGVELVEAPRNEMSTAFYDKAIAALTEAYQAGFAAGRAAGLEEATESEPPVEGK